MRSFSPFSILLLAAACESPSTQIKKAFETVNTSIEKIGPAENLLVHTPAADSDYFKQAPTVAALTILSKLQSDCANAAAITLEDIDQHL